MIASYSPALMTCHVARLHRLQAAARAAYLRHVRSAQTVMTQGRARFCENFLPGELATLTILQQRAPKEDAAETPDILDIPPLPAPVRAEKAKDDTPRAPRQPPRKLRPRLTLYGISPGPSEPEKALPDEAEAEEQRLLDEIEQVAKILQTRDAIRAETARMDAAESPPQEEAKPDPKKGRFLRNLFDVKPRFR